MPRLAPRLLLFAAHAALLAGCPREDVERPVEAEPSAAEETLELRQTAQKEALERLAPKVAALAALEDPVTTAIRDGSAPRMPPVGTKARAALRTALDEASREAKGLTPRLLDPGGRTLALASVFAINRARDHYVRAAPWLDDPTWITREVDVLVAALEVSARHSGTCTHCAAALSDIAPALESAANAVRSTSAPRAAAAAADARALADRVRALPAPETSATAALEAFATAMDDVDTAAPPRWGAKTLQRVLEVEENIADTPAEAFKSLGAAVSTLAALSAKHPVLEAGTPSAVTAQRCEAAWSEIQPVVAAQDALDAGDFDCAKFVAGVGTATFDDPGLRIALVDAALVHPRRRASQQAMPPLLSSLGGRIARGSQAHTLRAALLLGAPALSAAASRALEAELDAACLAAAALWIHAELGDDAALSERLDRYCPAETPSYIDRAQARPRQALEGLALSRVLMGPAGVVPLDELWWLPLGLLERVAAPPTEFPSPVRGVVEPLEPGTKDPAP
ncbi:MAG: hypothetical protein ACE37F_26420 [Nannocystaceae bacterium]|nr:hypothetical protein [bacterium]